MERTIERYEVVAVDAGDCVLVHGDVIRESPRSTASSITAARPG